MQQGTPKLTNLQWQLEVLIDIDPPIIGLALQDLGTLLAVAEPEEQAAAILAHFILKDFAGIRPFLKTVESNFIKIEPVSAVLSEFFDCWEALASVCDAELCDLASTQKVVALFPDDPNMDIEGISSRKKEGLARLFEPFDLYQFGQRGNSGLSGRLHHQGVIEALAESGPYRKYTFRQSALEKLNELRSTLPNFSEVTECVIDAVSLAMKFNTPIQITPILLAGEPGIGKSRYTAELVKCLGVPLARVAIDNLQLGAGLAGSSHIYSNSDSDSGEVFKVLSEQSHISPLVILDEIDKAQASHRDGDPLSPLHNLLEPVSAREFRDASVPIPIDASHVIWIATANYLERIPSAIKSRFEVFEIAEQNEETKKLILGNICKELHKEYPGIEFSEEVIGALVDKTPREQRQLLQRALSRTVRLGKTKVTLEHLEKVTTNIRTPEPKRWLGYL